VIECGQNGFRKRKALGDWPGLISKSKTEQETGSGSDGGVRPLDRMLPNLAPLRQVASLQPTWCSAHVSVALTTEKKRAKRVGEIVSDLVVYHELLRAFLGVQAQLCSYWLKRQHGQLGGNQNLFHDCFGPIKNYGIIVA
jgi:hypothetical protein